MKKIAVIGAGRQAMRRLPPILDDKHYKISWVIDRQSHKAQLLASLYNAKWDTDWKVAIRDRETHAVLVLTYPDSHAQISIAAMQSEKDVLCEKPLARDLNQAKLMVNTADSTKRILKCGFNHRYHPAVCEAYKIFSKGLIGRPLFGRGRYGIQGRIGLKKEWRSNRKIVGGGQLMEQGIHLIDLFHWFLGKFHKVTGFVKTNYWPIQPLEDNAFAILETSSGACISIHSSLTQWKNLFDFEIYGEKGYLNVSGLGGSYGTEKLIFGLNTPASPFNHKTIEYRQEDISWKSEWNEFKNSISSRREPTGNGQDGLYAMEVVNKIYKSSKTNRTEFLTK